MGIWLVVICRNSLPIWVLPYDIYYMKFSKNKQYLNTASGDEEIRTLDPLLARQVLSQLSYAPVVDINYALL